MTLRRQSQLKVLPAVKAKAKAKTSTNLSGRKCLTILDRLKKMVSIPKDAQPLARQAAKAAKSRKKAEQEKSSTLLGRVLAKVSKTLEDEVGKARQEVDKAEEQQKACAAEQSEAEIQLKTAQQEVASCRTKLKESNKLIQVETKALASCASSKKAMASDVKLADKECKQLVDVQEKMYQPLKQAHVHGAAARKQITALCKAGKKVGFHKELLGVAPAVLKKELARRRTFDQLVVKSLDSEFAKQAEALKNKLEETQQSLEEQEQTLEAKKKAVALAKETIKVTNRQIEEATEAVETGKRSVAAARKKVKGLPSVLKKVQKNYERVQGRYDRFRVGPLSAYLKHQPVRDVPDEDDDQMLVDGTLEDAE